MFKQLIAKIDRAILSLIADRLAWDGAFEHSSFHTYMSVADCPGCIKSYLARSIQNYFEMVDHLQLMQDLDRNTWGNCPYCEQPPGA